MFPISSFIGASPVCSRFYHGGRLPDRPALAVVYMGRERVMIDKRTSGDCNACHTQAGAGVAPNLAPGRIILP